MRASYVFGVALYERPSLYASGGLMRLAIDGDARACAGTGVAA